MHTNDIDDRFKGSQDATQYFWVFFTEVLVQHHTQMTH